MNKTTSRTFQFESYASVHNCSGEKVFLTLSDEPVCSSKFFKAATVLFLVYTLTVAFVQSSKNSKFLTY